MSRNAASSCSRACTKTASSVPKHARCWNATVPCSSQMRSVGSPYLCMCSVSSVVRVERDAVGIRERVRHGFADWRVEVYVVRRRRGLVRRTPSRSTSRVRRVAYVVRTLSRVRRTYAKSSGGSRSVAACRIEQCGAGRGVVRRTRQRRDGT